MKLPVEDIVRDGRQPRRVFDEAGLKELADSIRAQGLIQPILVRRRGMGFGLIAGERRWRAAQLAGLKEVPAIVREATDAQAFELALVENLQRTDLNPLEEAEGYQRLCEEFGLTQEEVSRRVGKERPTVANALRLLSLPDEVKEWLEEGALSMGHARALLGLSSKAQILEHARRVVSGRLSVRDTEALVKRKKGDPRSGKGVERERPEVRRVVEELQRRLGAKVRLKDRGGKGTVEIDYFSYEELDRILELIRR